MKITSLTVMSFAVMLLMSGCGKEKAADPGSNDGIVIPTIITDMSFDMSAIDNYTSSLKRVPYGSGIEIDGNSYRIIETKLRKLLESGEWQVKVDTHQVLAPCKTSEEFELNWVNDPDLLKIRIRVTNIMSIDHELADCHVSSVRIESGSDRVANNYHLAFSRATKDDLKNTYVDGLVKDVSSDELMIDNVDLSYIITSISMAESYMIGIGTNKVEESYKFANGSLSEMRIVSPSLLYGGLYENVSESVKGNLKINDNAFFGVAEKKNSLIREMSGEFSNAGIDVSVNESTGEIVLPSEILFATDKYELEKDGVQFVDRVFGVYEKCIMDPKYSDIIEGILIEGHTDTSGDYDYNLTLSQKRADSVLSCILENTHDNKISGMTTAKGRSFEVPVFDTMGNVDMDASRRVTIKFLIRL